MPSQPTAKQVLKPKRNTVAAIPSEVESLEVVPARTAIQTAWPKAPKSMSLRRPTFSMMKMAIQEAIKYSVPLHAARRRLRKPERPMLFLKMVAA